LEFACLHSQAYFSPVLFSAAQLFCPIQESEVDDLASADRLRDVGTLARQIDKVLYFLGDEGVFGEAAL
jgi:hypothetical protein